MNDNSPSSIDLEIEVWFQDSHFVATCRAFPGLTGAGQTEEAAKMALMHSLQAHLAELHADGGFSAKKTPTKRIGRAKYFGAVAVIIFAGCAALVWQMRSPSLGRKTEQASNIKHEGTDLEKAGQRSSQSKALTASTSPWHADKPGATVSAIVHGEKFQPTQEKEVIVDYESVFSCAEDFHLPSIALLHSHALKGIAIAQVCYARLVHSWGYKLEARAWAKKLGLFAAFNGRGEV